MKRAYILVVAAWITAFLCGEALAQNHPPEVGNVTAAERTDGSKEVDIYYALADADGDACTVTVQASNDAGTTWTVPITAVTGAVGSGITPGVNKLIVWDSATDLPGAFGRAYKVRVCADDGHVPAPPGMVAVACGSFQMGDPNSEGRTDERPVHTVYLSPYSIGTCEVTNQQYAAALNWAYAHAKIDDPSTHGGVVQDSTTGTAYCDTTTGDPLYSRITWNGSTFGVVSWKESHPMLQVSWYGSVAYCNWRSEIEGRPLCYDLSTWACNFAVNGYRLPTEAEWEKAAGWDPVQQRHYRFGEHTDGCGTDCLDGNRANYWNSGDPFETGDYPWTTPVGYYDGTTHGSYTTQNAQSYYGCYDMSGNVWEWCYDWFFDTYYSQTLPLMS